MDILFNECPDYRASCILMNSPPRNRSVPIDCFCLSGTGRSSESYLNLNFSNPLHYPTIQGESNMTLLGENVLTTMQPKLPSYVWSIFQPVLTMHRCSLQFTVSAAGLLCSIRRLNVVLANYLTKKFLSLLRKF